MRNTTAVVGAEKAREGRPARRWRDAAQRVAQVLAVCAPVSVAQLALYPGAMGDALGNWAAYWLYLAFGVVLPGTLLLVRTVRWRADWLAWVGLGWAVGHGLELAALLLAKQFAAPAAFLLWVPCAYLIALLAPPRGGAGRGRVTALRAPRRALAALAILCIIGSAGFFASNLPETSVRPPIGSDQWFHINNAHEFRDHRDTQDPRLAGDPFNYHMFSYGPAAAASLVTGMRTLNLLQWYAGSGTVFLVVLLLFNTARVLSGGRIAAGVVAALFLVAPVDIVAVVAPQFAFGTSIMLFGTYGSTSTLGGYLYLTALLLPLLWFYESGERRDVWVIALLAFGGAGAKSMIGPLLLCATLAVVAVAVVAHRRIAVRALLAFAAVLASVVFVTIPLVFGEHSYRTGVQWAYAIFATATPYYPQMITRGWPDGLVRALWLFGFAPLPLLLAALATWRHRRTAGFGIYALFIWAMLLAALVPTLAVDLLGFTQMFFLYYALIALGTLAGCGVAMLLDRIQVRPAVLVNCVGIGAVLFFGSQILSPASATRTAPTLRNQWSEIFWQARADYWWHQPLRGEGDESLRQARFLCSQAGGCPTLFLTTDIRQGLEWARRNTPTDAVFAMNVPGAAAYGGYSERRAFYETASYNAAAEASHYDPVVVAAVTGRRLAIQVSWQAGEPDTLARMRAAGITLLFVDRVNGSQVPPLPGLPPPAYESRDFAVYRLK